MNNVQKKRIITDTLIKAGASIYDNGFYLLRDIVSTYIESENPVKLKQKDVFAAVEKKYNMSLSSVQKYIRIPIDNAMRYAKIEFLEGYFGICYRPETGTVTPKAFIMRVVDDVLLQIEELEEKGGAA